MRYEKATRKMAEDGQRGLHIQIIHIKINKPVKSLNSNNSFTVTSDLTRFCYWYVNMEKIQGDDEEVKRNMIIDAIKKSVIALEDV